VLQEADAEMAAWRRYVVYTTARNVINEVCLSHYACNFFFYVVTGKEFRSALSRLCRRDAGAGGDRSSVTAMNRTHSADNGTRAAAAAERGAPPVGRSTLRTSAATATPAANEQKTLLARI